MALPQTGELNFNLFNTDRGIASGTAVDMDAAAIAYGIPTRPHGMDEFYGRSASGPPPPPTPPPPTPPTPTPPPPPTVWHIELCFDGRVEYVTLGGSSINPLGAGKIYKFSDAALPGCWIVQGTGPSATFSNVTATNEYADCTTCNPPTPPTPPPPTPAPTPPPTPPPPTTYSFILAYDGGSGAQACANRNSNTNMGTKWSLSSAIGSGVYLYNSQVGAQTNDAGDYVANGYYSDGTTYWQFTNGNTSDAGTSCTPPPTPPTPPPPTPPPTPPASCRTWNVYNTNAFEAVSGNFINCAGGADSFIFYDDFGQIGNLGTICVLDGTSVEMTSTGGGAQITREICS
jgi:hypothetical protein